MARRMRLSMSEYARELPPGVILKFKETDKTFALMRGGMEMATRPEEVVRQWKNPDKVFASIARRLSVSE